MKLLYCETLCQPSHLEGVLRLLRRYGDDFTPSLFGRSGTCQQGLAPSGGGGTIDAYFAAMRQQPFLLSLEDDTVTGFFTFRRDFVPPPLSELARPGLLGLYITTILVDAAQRRRGTARQFYRHFMSLYPDQDRLISTRTWSTNASHIGLLEKLRFDGPVRLKDDRGPGIDTVYYYKHLGEGVQ